MGTTRGYARVSTPRQSILRQIEAITKYYPGIKIYEEKVSGRKVEGRAEFIKLLNVTKAGDTIVFDSVSRMSRNADEGIKLYFELFDKGVNLVFIKEPHINTEVYRQSMDKQIEIVVNTGNDIFDSLLDTILKGLNRLMIELAKEQIRLAFEQSEKEVQDLRVRTSEGVQLAIANGKQVGQVKGAKLNVKKKPEAKERIRKYAKDFGGGLPDIEVMKIAGISKNTYYKYKKEVEEEIREEQNNK